MATTVTQERKIWEKSLVSYMLATIGVLAFTLLIDRLRLDAHVANVSMFYLLLVIVSALALGRGAAIWTSVTSFLAFNWFFVSPRYTFDVHEAVDWSVLVMFLIIATVTGQLMALLKARAWDARQHERETAALAEASWAVASQLDTRSALLEVLKQVSKVVQLEMAAIFIIEDDAPHVVASYPHDLGTIDLSTMSQESQPTDVLRIPVTIKDKDFGFVFLKLPAKNSLTTGQRQIIDSLVSHSAVIFQRDDLMKSEAAARALADADRLKTALLSMVSHDFRSPLTSIKASVSTLLEEGTPLDVETQRGLHQAIDQETDRLNRMVGNILDLSRLEADAWRPNVELTPVTELVGMALDQFSSQNNNRIDVKLDPALTDVNVDCVQMVQVFKNLIENALKYSKETEKIEISSSINNGKAVLEVLDRGRGIEPEEVEHLFEPFYRANDLQESSVPGVGVGLAVCRGLVEAHGGILSAENREGGGAIFRVTLPLQLPEKIRDHP